MQMNKDIRHNCETIVKYRDNRHTQSNITTTNVS